MNLLRRFELGTSAMSSALPGRKANHLWLTNHAGYDYSGFILQSATNLVAPVVWSTNSPAPLVANGLNTVTNPITGAQQFYRLGH